MANDYVKTIFEEVSEVLQLDVKAQTQWLYKIAQEYKQSIEKNKEALQTVKKQYKILGLLEREVLNELNSNNDLKITKSSDKFKQEYTKRKEELENLLDLSKYDIKDFYKASMKFNEQILTFLTGQQQYITLVIEYDKHPIVIKTTYEDFFQNKGLSIQKARNDINIAAKIGINTTKVLEEMIGNIMNSFIGIDSLRGLNETYESSIATYDKFSPSKYVYWKPLNQRKWYKMKIAGGKGDIREAYAFFFLKDNVKANTLFMNHLYNNLDYFYNYGVHYVDNISGLYRPDVSNSEAGYSIKGLDASLAGFTQIQDLVNLILSWGSSGTLITKEMIERNILGKSYEQVKQGMEVGLRNFADQVAKQEFQTHYPIYIKF